MTPQEVKDMIGDNSSEFDQLYATLIPVLKEFAEDRCNKKFDSKSLPGGIKMFIAKGCEYYREDFYVNARTLGDASFNFDSELPKYFFHIYLKPYREVRLP